MIPDREAIAGVVLAGGRGRRMGESDKFLLRLGEGTLLQRVMERFTPQVGCLILSCNGDTRRLHGYCPVIIADAIPDFAGPLAGILSAMDWLRANRPGIGLVASAAADSPYLPLDLVERLYRALRDEEAEVAVAESAQRRHPVFALWSMALAEPIRHVLLSGESRALKSFQQSRRVARASWREDGVDPFFNINTPDDLRLAVERLRGLK